MNDLNDEWLQEQSLQPFPDTTGDASSSYNEEDLKAYRLLFNELNKEPSEVETYSVSGKVIARLNKTQERLNDFKLIAGVAIVMLLIFAASYLYLVELEYDSVQRLLIFVSPYKTAILFGAACLLMIQYLDRRLIKSKMHRMAQP